MKYTAEVLNQVVPVLKEQAAKAPAHLRERGTQLIAATEHVTRFADLMSPFIGPQIEELTASYLLPQIHSYLKEVSGQPATPKALSLMPAFVSGAKHTDLFGTLARVFGGRFG